MKRDGETERRWCDRYFSTSILRLAYQYSSDMRNFIILPFRSTYVTNNSFIRISEKLGGILEELLRECVGSCFCDKED